MTGTLPPRAVDACDGVSVDDAAARHEQPDVRVDAQVRPWSALVCGVPGDGTLLVVDWLLLACRIRDLGAHAVPVTSAAGLHGMYLEVAGDSEVESALDAMPWGAVDLLVAGEHLELMRAIDAGFVRPEATTVVSSCRRSFTAVERACSPQHVLQEREIDAAASASARAYHGFDGPEVAGWYRLPPAAQPGLLLGAICGSGATGLDEDACREAIALLAIDVTLHLEAFRRGLRLGRRTGGRVRRTRTAYQFTRRRRALVDNGSRSGFEALVARADELVHPSHVGALQDAIFRLCEFQDAAWAARLVDHVADIAAAERAALRQEVVDTERSVVLDSIRSLAALLVWPDAAWVANRKLRPGRLKELRAAHGISRRDGYELVDVVSLDRGDLDDLRHPRTRGTSQAAPALLQPTRVERIRTTSVAGAMRLRRWASAARHRDGSRRQQRELDTVACWLEALHDSLRLDHDLARIVARSGSLVQGAGAVRDANRLTAQAFWGRVVRQTIAIDRAAGADDDPRVARCVIPFVWDQLCRSGPLALWEYASPVLAIALGHARGVAYDDTVQLAAALCGEQRACISPRA